VEIPEYQDNKVGVEVRKTIAKTKTYRVRRGNGAYGSILGRRYQDTMAYYTPTNPQTEPQQDNRDKFKEQVKEALKLSLEERQPYIEMAKRIKGWNWLNAYLHIYLT